VIFIIVDSLHFIVFSLLLFPNKVKLNGNSNSSERECSMNRLGHHQQQQQRVSLVIKIPIVVFINNQQQQTSQHF